MELMQKYIFLFYLNMINRYLNTLLYSTVLTVHYGKKQVICNNDSCNKFVSMSQFPSWKLENVLNVKSDPCAFCHYYRNEDVMYI